MDNPKKGHNLTNGGPPRAPLVHLPIVLLVLFLTLPLTPTAAGLGVFALIVCPHRATIAVVLFVNVFLI